MLKKKLRPENRFNLVLRGGDQGIAFKGLSGKGAKGRRHCGQKDLNNKKGLSPPTQKQKETKAKKTLKTIKKRIRKTVQKINKKKKKEILLRIKNARRERKSN